MRLFGEATAERVNLMSEDDCVQQSKQIVSFMLGEEEAEEQFAHLE